MSLFVTQKIFFESQLSEPEREFDEYNRDDDGIDMNDISDCIDLGQLFREKRKQTQSTNGTYDNSASSEQNTTENINSEESPKNDEASANGTINGNQNSDLMNGNVNKEGNRRDDDNASMTSSSRQSVTEEDITNSPEYKQLFDEVKGNVVRAIKFQFRNSSAHVRRVAVLMLDFLGKTTININDLLMSYVSGMHNCKNLNDFYNFAKCIYMDQIVFFFP